MRREIHAVDGNTQRLDGGAMFGNAPKAVWQKWIQPDEQNRIPLACRAMLILERDEADVVQRRILCETGIGAFFEPKMRDRFGVMESEHVLLESLRKLGHPHESIDVVVLSHLHFDHAGGLLSAYSAGESPHLLFPKAQFVVSAEAFARAEKPHARDRASFIAELPLLLQQSGRLELVPAGATTTPALGVGYSLHFSHGHTPGLMLLEVLSDHGPMLFAGDLIPGRAWVHAPITMGYDRFPELLIEEKTAILEDLVQRGGSVFFTHDASVAHSRIASEQGRFVCKT